MIIYFVIILLLYVANPVSNYGYLSDGIIDKRHYWKRNKQYFWFAIIIFVIIMGLRDSSVGTDISNYKRLYEGARYSILDDYHAEDEKGYFFIAWLFIKLNLPWQAFLFFCSSIIVISWSVLFYRYSEDQFLCYLINIGLGIFAFCMTGMRQALAISLTLFSMTFVEKKKPIPFVLLVLLAYTFHNSAIVFLVAYPIAILEMFVNTKTKVWILYCISLATYFFKSIYAKYFNILSPTRYLEDGRYTFFRESSGLSIINILYIAGMLFVVAALWGNAINENQEEHRIYNIMYLLGCCSVIFTVLSYSSTMIGRLSLYFHLYIIIALVNGISRINNPENRKMCRTICIVVALLAILISFPDSATDIDRYKFFFMR